MYNGNGPLQPEACAGSSSWKTLRTGMWKDVRRSLPFNPKDKVEHILEKLDARFALPNSPFYAALLQRYGNDKALFKGKQVHTHLARYGHDRDTFLGNHLVNMYGKCGDIDSACEAFQRIRQHNAFSFNILIQVYAQNGHLSKARCLFEEMQQKNTVSWNTIITAYAQKGNIKEAKSLFDRMPDRNVVSWNALVSAYAQNGYISDARTMFENMPTRNIESWNAMVAGYAQSGHSQEAIQLFRRLCAGKMKPDDATFIAVLEACSNSESLEDGKFVHSRLHQSDFSTYHIVQNSLLNMYGKCRCMEEAKSIFDSMPERDLVSWNTMIAIYAQCGLGKEGVLLFKLMDLEGQEVDSISLISVFEACEALNSPECSKAVHASIQGLGYESDLVVGTAMLNMYSKCGSVASARSVFEEMHQQDILSWTAIIVGHARNGYGKEALELFRRFGLEGVQPDPVAFLNIISACSHAGLMHDGRDFFVALYGDYNVPVSVQHYHCIIDLLGRVGQLRMAEELIHDMPYEPDAVAWVTLLGACKTQGDAERGARIAQFASAVQPDISSPYVYQYTL